MLLEQLCEAEHAHGDKAKVLSRYNAGCVQHLTIRLVMVLGVTYVTGIHPQTTMNICTKAHVNASDVH